MQFSKIWGEGNNLKNPKNNQNKKISKALAFSLIELSIVLIIIGLLVAGVTGGASLIESAKIRGTINEFRGYTQGVYAFLILKNRLPGDLNGIGKIGQGSGNSYKKGDFAFPYDGTDEANNHYSPDMYTAPWVDMYLEKTIDFEPKGKIGSHYYDTAKAGNMPFSNSFRDNFFGFSNYGTQDNVKYYTYNFNNKNVLYIQTTDDNHAIKAEIAKKIDQKMDDGVFNEGNLRSYCRGTVDGESSYDDAINYPNKKNGKGACTRIIQGIGI